jgi:transcription initiation factor IIE alpha subunit
MVNLVCPKCKKKIDYFLAYSKSLIRVYSYDGKKFKMIDMQTNFSDMNFVCPKCDEIVSRDKNGIDFYIHKKFIRNIHKNVKPVKQIKY